jgi:hypothetical protein
MRRDGAGGAALRALSPAPPLLGRLGVQRRRSPEALGRGQRRAGDPRCRGARVQLGGRRRPRLPAADGAFGRPADPGALDPGPGPARGRADLGARTRRRGGSRGRGRLHRARLPRLLLPNPEASDGTSEDEGASTPAMRRMVGVARFEVHAPPKYEAVRPQPTVMTGYEFLVTAKTGAKPLGATKLLMRPGSVPALRLPRAFGGRRGRGVVSRRPPAWARLHRRFAREAPLRSRSAARRVQGGRGSAHGSRDGAE